MTPNTSAYMIAGYIIFFTIMTIYIISLIVRWHNLIQELAILENLEKDQY